MNTTTSPVKTLIDEQLEEVAAATPSEALELARSLGFIGWPVRAYREPNGLWVHRYDKRGMQA